jgi:hypothetical protein
MADRNQKIFDRVRQELAKNGKLGSRQLYEMAKGWDQSIGQDSLQQFHARYVLPIKRQDSSSKGKGRAGRQGAAGTGRQGKAAADSQKAPAARQRDGRSRGGKAAAGSERDRIRSVLLEFARDFADAESRSDIVQVVSRVDDYVNRIAPGQD